MKYIYIGAILIGLLLGIGGYTFLYARGWAYLTNESSACANCHIMNDQYGGWLHGSHRSVATCNDCHTPHDFLGKWSTKASNGFWHSFYFTTGTFKEPIEITARDRRIVESQCRHCHQAVVQGIDADHEKGMELHCARCHGSVGHMR